MIKTYVIVLLCTLVSSSGGYKILLVFPYPSRSHVNLAEGFLRPLLKAGHDVTYITPMPMKNPPKNLKQVNVSSVTEFQPPDILKLETLMNPQFNVKDIRLVLGLMHHVVNGTLHHEAIQELLMDRTVAFDLVIAEWLYSELYAGFSSVFNCPYIWSSSMDHHWMVLRLMDEPSNPAYTGDLLIPSTTPYDFITRVEQLWMQIKTSLVEKWIFSYLNEASFRSAFEKAAIHRGLSLPPFEDVKHNASLMFSNTHVSVGESVRLPQNVISIGGYHIIEEVAPLPKDLQKIMDKSKHGVIYFSMGSMIQAHQVPEKWKLDLIEMFSRLKYTVLWKLEKWTKSLPQNVHIVDWVPQTSVLAHPKTKLFITHGGLLSTTEAVHFGVPVIGIPGFGDQHLNVVRARSKGFAEKVDLTMNIAEPLNQQIQRVLGNSRYTEKVKELSYIYHDRAAKPSDEIAHWVRHVIETRGARHLRSPAFITPWYQKMYLDLLALILIVILFVSVIIKRIFVTTVHKKQKML